MFPVQKKDYGKKLWLIQLDPKPHAGGRLIVARTRGRNGTILTFNSCEDAEEFIKKNPKWGEVSTVKAAAPKAAAPKRSRKKPAADAGASKAKPKAK